MTEKTIFVLLEYALLPAILIFGNFFTKFLTKENARFEFKEFLAIGLEVVLMSILGIAIYGISIYSHNNDIESLEFTIYCLAGSFFLLILYIILAGIIRIKGESANSSLKIQWFFAFIAIVILLSVINKGEDNMNAKNHLIPEKKTVIKKDCIKQI